MPNDIKNQLFKRFIFAWVAEYKSFTKASKKLNLSKSVVSKCVSELEAELQMTLIHRSTRRLSLSESGEKVYDLFMPLLKQYEEANRNLSLNSTDLQGRFHITCSESMGMVVEDTIAKMAKKHPKIRFRITIEDTRLNLIEHNIDLAISVGPLQDSQHKSLNIGNMREVFVVSKSRKQDLESNISFQSIPYIANEWEKEFLDVNSKGKVIRLKPEIHFRTNSLYSSLSLVRKGLGMARVPFYLVESELKKKTLIQIFEHYKIPSAKISIIHPFNLPSAKINAFHTEFKENCP